MSKYEWLDKRTLRAVDQLRLWSENPRLNPEEKHVTIEDFASDLISDNAEKDSFFELVDSIASKGFIPADPIVVWQSEENKKYYVAEGNRRILALKLLRSPEKSPSSIRNYIRKKSALIDSISIEKVRVSVAPSLEETEWYINQRHSSSSLQRPWSRLQQQRWIAELYDKYGGDIDKVSAVTGLNKSQLEFNLRILKIRDLALLPSVLSHLNEEEQEKVKSHRIPMTILERWFLNPQVKEKWGIEFEDDEIKITSNMESFLRAYVVWLKNVIHRDEPDVLIKIDTRTITSNLDELLKSLPEVSFEVDNIDIKPVNSPADDDNGEKDKTENIPENDDKKPLNKNPDRNQLVLTAHKLSTSSHKLDALFREFKLLPVYKYKNTTAASIRVFLDLAVAEYISTENCLADLVTEAKKPYHDIPLKYRLEYLKKNKIKSKTPAYKVIDKLLNSSNEHSLDTLNNYIHGTDQQHTNKRFLNGFWDFLFPLFEKIIGMVAS